MLTPKQLREHARSDDPLIRELATAAVLAKQRCAMLDKQLRRKDEQLAEGELSGRKYCLTVCKEHGILDTWALKEDNVHVKVAHLPALGPSRMDEAEEWMLSRLPEVYRRCYTHGRRISRDSTAGVMGPRAFRDLQETIGALKALNSVVNYDDPFSEEAL